MAAENTAFSSAGEEAITRSIDVEVDLTAQHLRSEEQFEDFYEIGSTARELVERGYKRVCTNLSYTNVSCNVLISRCVF